MSAWELPGVRALLASHLLSAWGDRMWEFATAILLAELFDSIAPAAAFSAAVFGSCVLSIPALGSWVDKQERLRAVRVSLIVGNACVAGVQVLLALLTILDSSASAASGLAFALVVLLSCVAEAMGQVQSLAISRDWVVQLCASDGARLSELNVAMQRLDLLAKVLAPALFGLLIGAAGAAGARARVQLGALLIGAWNVLSLPLELRLTGACYRANERLLAPKLHTHPNGTVHAHCHGSRRHVHPSEGARADEGRGGEGAHSHPRLAEAPGAGKPPHAHAHGDERHAHAQDPDAGIDIILLLGGKRDAAEGDPPVERAGAWEHALVWRALSCPQVSCLAPPAQPRGGRAESALATTVACWRAYFAHPVAGASVAFCLLFMTVLDNGMLVTSHLQHAGVSPAVLGLARTADAALGLAGTFLFPRLAACLGGPVERAALASVWAFWFVLAPAGLAFLLAGSTAGRGVARAAHATMLGCMVASRAALWSFDLAHTQSMQTRVNEGARGALNGCQASLSQLLFVAIQLCALGASRPEQFGGLLFLSLGSVLAAAVLYSHWFARLARPRAAGEGGARELPMGSVREAAPPPAPHAAGRDEQAASGSGGGAAAAEPEGLDAPADTLGLGRQLGAALVGTNAERSDVYRC